MNGSRAIAHRIDSEGVLRVTFDSPGEKVNLLNEEVLRELGRVLDEARARDDVRAVLFASAKPDAFIAGMDVAEIAAVTDAYRGAEGARFGQSVLQKVADFGRPSACAINGACLGGGTELALACTFRVASDGRAVRIGLPEVRLGIIPGFGGSQRLPRLVGLGAALDLILSGRTLDPKRARSLGLIDLVVPEAYLEREALALLHRAVQAGEAAVVRTLERPQRRLDGVLTHVGPLRRFVLDQARRKTEKRVRPADYPAPFRALEALDAALTRPLQEGLDVEARIVGELVPTETTRNLLWLFRSQNALKRDAGGIQASPRRVERVGVLGAGIMGGGIAQLVADCGLPVRLRDVRYDAILKALRTARDVWSEGLKRRRISRREVEQKMAFISPTLDEHGFSQVDLVLEAVVENLEVKRQVLADLERRLPERSVFASNTSSLPIGEIAARALRPERVVGLHFFNPVNKMPLVEVIAGRRSSPEAVATARAFALRLGKVPVVVADEPGFLVNRILTLYMNEALRLFLEGVPAERIDGAMVAFGMPLGPLALFDQVGLDTARHVAQIIGGAFGARIGSDGAALDALVSAGRLGQKNGSGFYRYRDGKRTSPDPRVGAIVGARQAKDLPPETLQERMVLAMVNEAVVCLQSGVAREARDIDLAMVLGTGFPPFRGGLLRFADSIGIAVTEDRLARLADAHGERFRPAALFTQMVRDRRRFYDGSVSRA